ncbi:hypothetical protein AB0K43_21635 [Kitasatospora sp. NPDC049258]|uniref:hypothetical protein n=1 Tax=Kitasatospora sp. NPDC049258 TaxID=3155394 RepID=UPI003446359F
MTQTVQPDRTATGLLPAQRGAHHPAPGHPEVTVRGHLGRAFAVVRGLRALRPVPARPQEPYGESDGQ